MTGRSTAWRRAGVDTRPTRARSAAPQRTMWPRLPGVHYLRQVHSPERKIQATCNVLQISSCDLWRYESINHYQRGEPPTTTSGAQQRRRDGSSCGRRAPPWPASACSSCGPADAPWAPPAPLPTPGACGTPTQRASAPPPRRPRTGGRPRAPPRRRRGPSTPRRGSGPGRLPAGRAGRLPAGRASRAGGRPHPTPAPPRAVGRARMLARLRLIGRRLTSESRGGSHPWSSSSSRRRRSSNSSTATTTTTSSSSSGHPPPWPRPASPTGLDRQAARRRRTAGPAPSRSAAASGTAAAAAAAAAVAAVRARGAAAAAAAGRGGRSRSTSAVSGRRRQRCARSRGCSAPSRCLRVPDPAPARRALGHPPAAHRRAGRAAPRRRAAAAGREAAGDVI
jgi:hypothetical protein